MRRRRRILLRIYQSCSFVRRNTNTTQTPKDREKDHPRKSPRYAVVVEKCRESKQNTETCNYWNNFPRKTKSEREEI